MTTHSQHHKEWGEVGSTSTTNQVPHSHFSFKTQEPQGN